jgi:ribosomal protein S27AE
LPHSCFTVTAGIPAEEQRLTFGGRQLADGAVLAECGVTDEGTLHSLARLLGGGKKRKKKTYTKPKKIKHKHKKIKLRVLKFYKVRAQWHHQSHSEISSSLLMVLPHDQSPTVQQANALHGPDACRAEWSCTVASQVDDSGKVQRLRKVCPAPTCGPGTFMATHFNRVYWCVLAPVSSCMCCMHLLYFSRLSASTPDASAGCLPVEEL